METIYDMLVGFFFPAFVQKLSMITEKKQFEFILYFIK